MKRQILINVSLWMVILICYHHSYSQQPFANWDYPIKPGSIEWNNLTTAQERFDACQIPQTVLQSINSVELINLCLNYPLYQHIIFSNNRFFGFQSISERFNGIQTLRLHKDYLDVLLKVYENIGLDKKLGTMNNSEEVFRTELIEFLIFDSDFLNILSESEILKLKHYAIEVLQDKNKIVDKYGFNTTILPTSLILGKILISENNIKGEDYDEIIRFLETGNTPYTQVIYSIYEKAKIN